MSSEGNREMKSRIRPILCLASVFSLVVLLVLFACNRDHGAPVEQEYLLQEYYIHMEPWEGSFDSDGIPLVDYGGEIGLQYNPVTISQHALANWALYLKTSKSKYRETFMKQADWLIEHLVLGEGRGFYVWEYHFDFVPREMKAPWISAMAQGQGISVLLRAYELTEEEKYLEAAEAALEAFEIPIGEGGVMHADEKGFVWYEEYPGQPPPHVLNGFIFALFGLNDFYKATASEKALRLFDEGIETLEANLHRYDIGYWSAHDLTEKTRPCTLTFRLKTDTSHPLNKHPIDEIAVLESLEGVERVLASLDVGHQSDTTAVSADGSRLYYDPHYWDWGESYILDGHTVRDYQNLGGKWAQAPFDLTFAVNDSARYYMSISYKDTSEEPVYLEVFLVGKKYFRIGGLDANNTGKWRTNMIEIPHSLLSLTHGTSESYHRLHIEQLKVLHEITGKRVFHEYALRFEGYLEQIEELAS